MERGIYEIVDTESLVPAEHLLRKIDAAINWNKLYDMVEPLYCEDNGRPSIDPVVLFKMVLIQHLYGMPSLRRTAEEVRANIYYRWFLGYRLQEETPHFSTISYNFKHRFTPETVNQIFDWILSEIAEAGYLYTHTVFVDGTHIKANANNKKVVKEEVEVEAKRYAEELMEEVNADRIAHGKKPFATEGEETDEKEDNDPPSTPKKKRDNTSKKKLKKRKKEAKKKEEPIKEEKQAESKAEVTKPEKREPAIVPVVKASSVQEQATEKPTHQPVKAPQKEEVTVTDSKKADVREVPDLLDSHNVFYGIGANQGNEFVLDDDKKGGNSL